MKMTFFLALSLLTGVAQAQQATPAPRHSTLLDAAGAVGQQRGYGAVAAWRLWGLTATDRFQVGLGVRATAFFLPAQLYDGQTLPAENRLRVEAGRQWALNTALHLRARVAGPVRVGFNIDVAGLTLGSSRRAQQLAPSGSPAASGSAQPVRGNLLLGGRHDRGSLNSDFYLGVDVSAHWHAHVGFSHVVNGYALSNERFQQFANLGAVGVTYRLSR